MMRDGGCRFGEKKNDPADDLNFNEISVHPKIRNTHTHKKKRPNRKRTNNNNNNNNNNKTRRYSAGCGGRGVCVSCTNEIKGEKIGKKNEKREN